MDIDLPRMLLELRAIQVDGDEVWGSRGASALERLFYGAGAFMACHPALYRNALGLASRARKRLSLSSVRRRRTPVLEGWTRSRELPPVAATSFRERWQKDPGDKSPRFGAPGGKR